MLFLDRIRAILGKPTGRLGLAEPGILVAMKFGDSIIGREPGQSILILGIGSGFCGGGGLIGHDGDLSGFPTPQPPSVGSLHHQPAKENV